MLLVPLSGLLIQAQENKLVCQQTIIVLNIIQDVLKFFGLVKWKKKRLYKFQFMEELFTITFPYRKSKPIQNNVFSINTLYVF